MLGSAPILRSLTLGLVLSFLGCDRDEPAGNALPAAPGAKAGNRSPESQATPLSRTEQARAKLGRLKTELKAALMAAAQGGNLERAVTECQVQAPVVTAAQMKEGVKIGRSALKLRNPANTAPEWVVPLMQELSREAQPEGKFRDVSLPEGHFGYVEAITTSPMCEGCHGADVDEAVSAKLAELYPDDEATGFSAGSFRGVFWVDLPPK